MDFELLNFWIENYNFIIVDNKNPSSTKLFLRLKACNVDIMRSSLFLLSSEKEQILDFFGFDTSIEYDYLKSYNQYEFLCSSKKLSPRYINYRGFKGPHSKDSNHEKFNKYLKGKYISSDYRNDDHSLISAHKKVWLERAIKFFNKENEYQEYIDNRNLLDNIFKKREKNNIEFNEFRRFLSLHGVLNVSKWDDDKFQVEISKFVGSSWNTSLSIFHPKYFS